MRGRATVMASGLVMASALGAQTAPPPTPPAASKARPAKDPNRVVCERIDETGSRLNARTICMTAAEWAAQRQADKDLTDHLQSQTYKDH